MPFSPSDSKIFGPLFNDAKSVELFSDEQFVRYLLNVEAALARVQGELGVIPRSAAKKISVVASELQVDFAGLQTETELAGIPLIELVRQLRQAVGDEAASYVHWGATSQDIMDTALVLQMRAALGESDQKLRNLLNNLARLSDRHRDAVMAGRTLSQQALPIPFGFKVVSWLAPLIRHRQRLREIAPRLFVVQFGGAVGTLASLGERGIEVQQALAQELDLDVASMPWHTQRDNLAEVAGWLSMLTGSLAKMAQDVILLAQTEIGEVRESADPNRGGSSTMPQKSNPVVSELIVAAARINAALLSSMHQALIQEHERATHSWQMEWLALPQMFGLTAAALTKALFISENLVVNETRMAQNVSASNGLMLAEALEFALAETMPRSEAKTLLKEACLQVVQEGRHLVDVVQEKSGAALDWQTLRDETNYLGSAHEFVSRVLSEAQAEAAVVWR